jgi:hypothetical protein
LYRHPPLSRFGAFELITIFWKEIN